MDVYTKKCKELATQIEHKRGKEREIQESIEEESKNMEKMANKRAVKLRKVLLLYCITLHEYLPSFL